MRVFFHHKLVICILTLVTHFPSSFGDLQTYVLQNVDGNCSVDIVYLASVVLKSHSDAGGQTNYQNDQDCSVTFQASEGEKIHVQFSSFDLEPPVSSTCIDKLVITEKGNGSTDQTEICTKQDFVSATNKLEIKFFTDSANGFKGFVGLVTSVHDGPCSASYFSCNSTWCIASELMCDGYRHCFNGIDETRCSSFLGKYVVVTIAAITSGIMFCIFITVLLWKYFSKDGKCSQCSTDDIESDNGSREISPVPVTRTSRGKLVDASESREKASVRSLRSVRSKPSTSSKQSADRLVKDDSYKVVRVVKTTSKNVTVSDVEW